MESSATSDAISRLSSQIAGFPEGGKVAARQGFEILRGLSEADRAKAVELMFSSFEKGSSGSADTELLAKEIPNLTGRGDAGRVMTALSIAFALVTQNEVSSAEFVQAGSGKIFDADSEATASSIANVVIARRATLARAMERRRLANEVLPSFVRFDVTVDLRIRFQDGRPRETVAVALAHIDTDVDNNEIWLQMSRADVDTIIEKLQNTAAEMDATEELLRRVIPEPSGK
jgi:hypothetical protein